MRIFGLLPAAGTSCRMGQPKLALPLGEHTVLQRVLQTLQSAGVQKTLVVLGPQVASLEPLAIKCGAWILLLQENTPAMRTTVEHGLDWLEKNEHPRDNDAFLLLPADHPALSVEAVRAVVAAGASHSEASIWIPTHEGRRGHPTLIAWKHVAAIRAFPQGQGLNQFLRAHAADTVEVPCSSEDILFDLDTPGDYERLRNR